MTATPTATGSALRRDRRRIVAAMSMVATLGFRSALSGWSFVTAAAIGALGASAVVGAVAGRAAAARRERRPLGGRLRRARRLAVGGIPTPGAYGDFARGLVDGWADLLSSAPPADITASCGRCRSPSPGCRPAIGGEIARHVRAARPAGDRPDPRPRPEPAVHRRGALAVAAPGRRHPRRALAIGVAAMVARATGRGADDARSMAGRPRRSGTRSPRRRRGWCWLVVAVAAPLRRPAPAARRGQRALRPARYQVPPFDPLAVPSPLVQVKASLEGRAPDDVVFTVAATRRSTAGRSP